MAQVPFERQADLAAGQRTNLARQHDKLAARLGLPRVGQQIVSESGVEFRVEGHRFLPSLASVERWNDGVRDDPSDLHPIVVPTNLSERTLEFVAAVDRCTTRQIVVADTAPHARAAVPHHHCMDSAGTPDAVVLYLDIANVHETVFAHEIGHAWVQYVERCEDDRVLKDTSDLQRLHQLAFIQSFVLDLKVNEVLRRKGFDMSPIDGDMAASMDALASALSLGYRPETARESLFLSLHLAAQIVEQERENVAGLARFDRTLNTIRFVDEELYGLGKGMAEAVFEFGLDSKEAVQAVVDACLNLGFAFTGDSVDLDSDLIVPPQEEPDIDKYPQWLQGAYPMAKCEVGRHMALNAIPEGSRTHLENRGDHAMLSFILPDGSVRGLWRIPVPFAQWLMTHATGEAVRTARLTRERQEKQLKEVQRMNFQAEQRRAALLEQAMGRPSPGSIAPPTPQPNAQGPGLPVTVPMPGGLPGRRPYMAGLGRFVTVARLAERLAGEHPYGYAMNNPVTYTDPSGRAPQDITREYVDKVFPPGSGIPPWILPPGINPWPPESVPKPWPPSPFWTDTLCGLPTWGYGNCCGGARKCGWGSKTYNCADEACKKHDICVGPSIGGGVGNWLPCNKQFCNDLKHCWNRYCTKQPFDWRQCQAIHEMSLGFCSSFGGPSPGLGAPWK